jgi:hypothetical protein
MVVVTELLAFHRAVKAKEGMARCIHKVVWYITDKKCFGDALKPGPLCSTIQSGVCSKPSCPENFFIKAMRRAQNWIGSANCF